LKEFLESGLSGEDEEEAGDGEGSGGAGDDAGAGEEKEPKEEDPLKLKKAIVQVSHNKRPARLILNKRPSRDGVAWIK
ncbi:transcriptional repressor KorB C-terminal beta-barrel domain-containing protein, partial [Klebsiella pneumoniae]